MRSELCTLAPADELDNRGACRGLALSYNLETYEYISEATYRESESKETPSSLHEIIAMGRGEKV